VATIEITGGLLKAIKKRTGRTRKEMSQALNISEKWYGLIESGDKEISQKIKELAQKRFRKEIQEIFDNEKVNVYLADPDMLAEFLEFARKRNLQKKLKRKKSNEALLKIESLALGFHSDSSPEEISTLRSQLLPDDLERAKIYLAVFETDFNAKTTPANRQESIEAVRWFLRTMNQVFSDTDDVQISESDIFHYRQYLLPDDREKLIDVARKVDESHDITENQEESMVSAWKLLIGEN